MCIPHNKVMDSGWLKLQRKHLVDPNGSDSWCFMDPIHIVGLPSIYPVFSQRPCLFLTKNLLVLAKERTFESCFWINFVVTLHRLLKCAHTSYIHKITRNSLLIFSNLSSLMVTLDNNRIMIIVSHEQFQTFQPRWSVLIIKYSHIYD